MPEFFLELFSEEIPARFQSQAAEDFGRLITETLSSIAPRNTETYFGPRRIALAALVNAEIPATTGTERGPRLTAPDQAISGFLRKHNATREALHQEGDFYILHKQTPALSAAALIATTLPSLLWRFPWAKSMRWGGTSAFTWIRPLRRILCLLDGEPIGFALATPEDSAHGLTAANLTEGHRVHAPGPVAIHSLADWQETLLSRKVIPSQADRMRLIDQGLKSLAAGKNLLLVEDPGLLAEIAGLTEWPIPLLGRIDDAFMDLPPEVMQVSMRINQRYFALRTPDGNAAPWFAFAANIEAPDGGAAIVAGNERVLRARFSDARHFWDLDRKTKLADRVPALDLVTFQAELGTQGARARRLADLAARIAKLVNADAGLAARAALLAKADLVSGMVGEFPELQGIMGGYYAAHDGEAPEIAAAIRDHYAPKGAGDQVPRAPVAIAVALADKFDQLAGFFSIGQKPTGSGDPYALRRAALGIIRIIRENALRLPLTAVLVPAASPFTETATDLAGEILAFIIDRLRIQLRAEGARHDVLAAVFAAGADDDLIRALARTDAIAALLKTEDGANLLAAYKRAANILRIEDRKDGPHEGEVDPSLLQLEAETALWSALVQASEADALISAENFSGAMALLAALRHKLDAFFDMVTVNAEDPALRRNRLYLLAELRRAINRVADFAQIDSV
jgi:glycyl-tRNA synthetase beta chain